MGIYLICLIPFCTELVWDYLLIKSGKPDVIRLKHRAAMIAGSVLVYAILQLDMTFIKLDKAFIVAVLPFVFFDYALNKMRGLKWYYLSKSNGKWWDELLHKVNPYALLSARILVAVCLIVLYIII